jgi:hypothetical protein
VHPVHQPTFPGPSRWETHVQVQRVVGKRTVCSPADRLPDVRRCRRVIGTRARGSCVGSSTNSVIDTAIRLGLSLLRPDIGTQNQYLQNTVTR